MNNYPLLTSHFIVNWGGTRTSFSEVSGLSIEHDIVEYRDGASKENIVTKIPGIKKYGNIVLKRGIVKGDNEFYDWIKTIKFNQVERRDITITLLDEEHNPVVTWKVINSWPVKLESPLLNAQASEVAIESLELAHEGIKIEAE